MYYILSQSRTVSSAQLCLFYVHMLESPVRQWIFLSVMGSQLNPA